MKKVYKYILISAFSVLFGTGCSDYVGGDVNISPDDATDAPVNSIIVSAQTNLLGLFEGEDARMGSMWAQQFTGFERQYLSYDRYVVSSSVFSWFQDYIGVIQPCIDALERLEGKPGVDATRGMLKVMQAMIYGNLTALYGDIPFSQANQTDLYPFPEYDAQTDVYAGVQLLLNDAIADLEAGNTKITNTDILGDNNTANWIAVANTLKARYSLHTGDYASAVTYATLGLDVDDPGLVGEHGDVNSGNVNLWWDFVEFSRSGYLTATDANLPKLLDPSQAIYRGDAKTDESSRFAFYYEGTNPDYVANISAGGVFAKTASYSVLTGVENALILAEALMKIATPDPDAALAALNIVRNHNENTIGGTYDDYVLTDFDVDGMAGDPAKSVNESLLEEIIEEKYCSLVGTIEVFNDLRRLDNPLGLTPKGTGGAFPERFIYPQSEINTNPNTPNPLPDLFAATTVNQ